MTVPIELNEVTRKLNPKAIHSDDAPSVTLQLCKKIGKYNRKYDSHSRNRSCSL